MTFADKLQNSIENTKSSLIAGCDPVIEKLPQWLLDQAKNEATDSSFIKNVLGTFTGVFLDAVGGKVAAIKPNIAFFEQYGIPGLEEFLVFCEGVRARGIPLVIDAKRGDIGSTASAYSSAFLGRSVVRGSSMEAFSCDALTVNPYLGFDTLEPFIEDCKRHSKGLFILVKTSNPGSKAIQGLETAQGAVAAHVARWIGENAKILHGASGWSGLGAVVGATYPEEARYLRELMPNSFFLIPGFGAQGGKAEDAAQGFANIGKGVGGAIVNVSRGLLAGDSHSAEEFHALISTNAARFNGELNDAIGGVCFTSVAVE